MRKTVRTALSAIAALSVAIAGVVAPAHATPTDEVDAITGSASETAEVLADLLDSTDLAPGEVAEDGTLVPVEASDDLVLPTASEDQPTFTMGLPIDAEAELTDSGAVAYVDEDVGTALVVQGVPEEELDHDIASGLRTLITIEDESAPTAFEFPINLDEGLGLELIPGEGVVAIVDADGGVTGILPAPWALDAEGNDLPTWYEIEGDVLVQHVLHEYAAAYPVIADPVWFVPVIVVGARVAVQIAVRASTQTAARNAAAAAARAQTGKALSKVSGTIVRAAYKSFTRSNARHNLAVRTGRKPSFCQAHHTMPQAMEKLFKDRGLNIHDPGFLLWWISTPGLSGNHGSKAAEYNRAWSNFFKNNPKATRADVLRFRTTMVSRYASFYRC